MYNKYVKARNKKGTGGMKDIEVLVGASTFGKSETAMTPPQSVAVVTPAHLQHAKRNNWNNTQRV